MPSVKLTAERTHRSLPAGNNLIAVDRGAYVPPPDSTAPLWLQRQYITLARCEAVLHTHTSAISRTHEAAAVDTLKAMIEEQGLRAGKRRARAVVAMADPRAESPGESALRRVVHAVGLPDPQIQERWQVHRVEWSDLRDRESRGRRPVDLFPPSAARLTRRRKDLWL
ncbi:hypothetical protein [Actinomyces qiguomingii]|uniref:hypothetical protein n=1 Tax=Actinomyces qiguomingii TaxID=2057800 RepID=UPI000CA02E2A|nr:hypothetical protein [Actinomyces qiguomingii]